MKRFEGFEHGVNLGGWLSQCVSYEKEHFDTFILEEDIKRIADGDWIMYGFRLTIVLLKRKMVILLMVWWKSKPTQKWRFLQNMQCPK